MCSMNTERQIVLAATDVLCFARNLPDGFLALCVDAEFLIAEAIDFLSGSAFHVWLNNEMHFAELACTTGLFLVAIVGTCGLCDGLAIRNEMKRAE